MKYHPIYNAYGAGDYLNNLRGEFYEIPASLRNKWRRKSCQRSLLLAMTGQSWLEQQRIPAGTKRILWFYDWNTLGDSIMDLSQRQYLADRYKVDICMPSGPAELFMGDRAFEKIYTDINQCPDDYDFILLHDISSRSMGIKLRRYFWKPWASMIRHQQGEQYARSALSAYRFSQFLGAQLLPASPTVSDIGITDAHSTPGSVAVALGGGDPRRRINDWPALLQSLVDAHEAKGLPIQFTLMGSGEEARKDVEKLSADFLARYCRLALDQPDLTTLKRSMAENERFIGCDSGLMHLAEALSKPGVALFGHIRPEWRLLPASRLRPLFSETTVNTIPRQEVVNAFMSTIS